jgi:hypothetical protein
VKGRQTQFLKIIFILICICLIISLASSSSRAYQISRNTLNQGGAVWLPQSSFKLCSSAGQYLAGMQTGASMRVHAGFWNPWVSWVVDVKEEDYSLQPIRFDLKQNYPNPFNPITVVEYTLPKSSQVRIQIYNILGQRVRLLVDEWQETGGKKVEWDGKDDDGIEVGSGIYFYRVTAGDFVDCKKMTLIK